MMKTVAYYVSLLVVLAAIGTASGWHRSELAEGFVDMWCWRAEDRYANLGYNLGCIIAVFAMIVFAVVVLLAVMAPFAQDVEDKK